MRIILLFAFCFIFITSCSNTDDNNQRNPFLIDTNFNTQLGPIQTLDLEIPSNPIFVPNGGIRGFFVINTGSGLLAWEASDPNHVPNECSQMRIDGLNVACECEEHNYNLFTGQSNGEVLEYTLLPYRVSTSGNTITIFN